MHTDSQHAPLAPPVWPANKCSCIFSIRKSLNLTDVARNAREHQLLPFWSEPVACKQSGGRTRSVKRVTWCPKGKQVRPTIFTFHTDNKPLIIAVVQWVKSTQAHSVKGLLHPNYHKHFSYLATPAEKESFFFFFLSGGTTWRFGAISAATHIKWRWIEFTLWCSQHLRIMAALYNKGTKHKL